MVALLWLAEEQHYRGCVERAVAKWPMEETNAVESLGLGGSTRVSAVYLDERRDAIDDCAWPLRARRAHARRSSTSTIPAAAISGAAICTV